MTIGVTGVLNSVVSHAMSTGVFERVNSHEPKNAPTTGITAAVWVQQIDPIRAGGLASTSLRLELMIRIYQNFISEPQDEIDPIVVGAMDVLMTAYNGDFQLGGQVRQVDVLGAHGEPLRAQAGYLEQDRVMFRVMDIFLPLIINDAYEQVA